MIDEEAGIEQDGKQIHIVPAWKWMLQDSPER